MPVACESLVGDWVIAPSLHTANRNASGKVCAERNDHARDWAHIAAMAHDERNYLREWREFRGLTQEELADMVETTKAVISLLENEKRPLSSKWLRRIGDALDTQPGHILDHDPNELPSDVFEIWGKIAKKDRAKAARILQAFATGTEN